MEGSYPLHPPFLWVSTSCNLLLSLSPYCSPSTCSSFTIKISKDVGSTLQIPCKNLKHEGHSAFANPTCSIQYGFHGRCKRPIQETKGRERWGPLCSTLPNMASLQSLWWQVASHTDLRSLSFRKCSKISAPFSSLHCLNFHSALQQYLESYKTVEVWQDATS